MPLVMLVGTIDTMMVSHAGESAVLDVALVDMIDYLIITILSALATGRVVVVSQCLGSKDKEKLNISAGQLLNISAVLSVFIMIFCLVFHKVI